MRNIRSNKIILLILLLSFPTTILFGLISTNVYANEYVPEEHLDNRWHWHDDIQVDDIITYEYVIYMKNLSNDKMMVMSKEIKIYNITGFKNDTSRFGFGDISYINGTWNYYNCTSDKVIPYQNPYGNTPHNISGFGFNPLSPFRQYYEAEEDRIECIFLPINGSNGLQVDVMADIINKTYLEILYQIGSTPRFDSVSTSIQDENHNIYFKNTTNNYFINNTYYNNGTLRYSEGSYFYNDGSDLLEYNYTQKIVFNYNIVDEIEWSGNVGDTFYYGQFGTELKMVISGFKNDTFQQKGSIGSMWQCFETVLLNKSYWNANPGNYIQTTTNATNSLANNFYPWKSAGGVPLFMPKNTEIADLDFMWNNHTHEADDTGFFPFDDIYNKLENGYIVTKMKDSNNDDDKLELVCNQATGIMSYYHYNVSGVGNLMYFRKNMTVITNQAEAENVLLHSDFIGNNKIYMNFTYIPNEDLELYWAAMPWNPTPTKFPNEIYNMPLYLDVYANFSNYYGVNPVNFTINYDASLLSESMEYSLVPYCYNWSLNKWEEAPESWYILDTNANTMTIIGLENYDLRYPIVFALGVKDLAWGVDVDDILPYEVSAEELDINTLDSIGGYLDFWIYNITSIEDETKTWDGEPFQTFSQVNFTYMYYNHSLKRLAWNQDLGDPGPLMEFCANESSILPLKFGNQSYRCEAIPYILPLINGELNLTVLAPIMNETYFDVSSIPPKWDYYSADDDANNLFFSNSTHGYYMDLTYFENGILKKADIFYSQWGSKVFNTTITWKNSWNVTSEIEWSVKVGDEVYFGDMDKEFKYHIVEINETALNMGDMGLTPIPSIQSFSYVVADIYYWNSTHEYWMFQYTGLVSAANNLYPTGLYYYIATYLGLQPVWPSLLIPIGMDEYEMLDAMKLYMGGMKVDTISEIGKYYIHFTNSTGPHQLYLNWDNSTGVVKLMYGFSYYPEKGKFTDFVFFAKNRTALQLGNNVFDLDNFFVPDITGTANITTNSLGCEFYHAILDINPTNETLPAGTGTPLFYVDMMINNHSKLAGNFTLKVKFPVTLLLTDINLHLFRWYNLTWETMPAIEMTKLLTYNYLDNSVTVEMPSEDPFYTIGAWSYTYNPPGSFTLSSTAEDPDDDGNFNLTWGVSYLATSYSVFEYSSIIDETNIHLATLLGTYTTPVVHPIENYTDGTYYFIVRAQNAHASTLSNCFEVIVEYPGPPGIFSLTSDAGTPDDDGDFTLTWGAADTAVSYTVYQYSGYITEINSSLTTLASGLTSLSRPLTGYTNGTYYFIVVAHNAQGDTLSNCHTVIVAIPPEEPTDGDGGAPIPGYSLYVILPVLTIVTIILIKKKRNKLPKF